MYLSILMPHPFIERFSAQICSHMLFMSIPHQHRPHEQKVSQRITLFAQAFSLPIQNSPGLQTQYSSFHYTLHSPLSPLPVRVLSPFCPIPSLTTIQYFYVCTCYWLFSHSIVSSPILFASGLNPFHSLLLIPSLPILHFLPLPLLRSTF